MVSKKTVDEYASFYPRYTRKSVANVLNRIEKKGMKMSAFLVDYYMRPKRFGGLSHGRLRKVV